MAVQEDAKELFHEIWSPYCKGVSLLECPSGKAEDLREELLKRLEAGETKEAIRADMLQKFGTEVRMEPATSGRESLAYWVPYTAFLLVVALVLIFWMNRRKRKASTHLQKEEAPPPSSRNIRSDLMRDLDRELQD